MLSISSICPAKWCVWAGEGSIPMPAPTVQTGAKLGGAAELSTLRGLRSRASAGPDSRPSGDTAWRCQPAGRRDEFMDRPFTRARPDQVVGILARSGCSS